jgi:hypothetical protein
MDWREGNRRDSKVEQYVMVVSATMAHPVSRQWAGYRQRLLPT